MNGRNVYSQISKSGFDAAIFLDEISQYYLTDFYTTDGVVIVDAKGTHLITDTRYIEAVELDKQAGKLSEDVLPRLFDKGYYADIASHLKGIGAKKVCIDAAHVSVLQLEKMKAECEGIEFGNLTEICLEFRKVKADAEIFKIKKAQEITDAAFEHILGFINENRTELEVAAELEYFMRSKGASGMAFDTIAVSGKKSSMPHGVPGDVKLTKNSFFTMDYGAKYAGYCSDMTRTVVLGKADDEMKKIYGIVLDAQNAVIDTLKAGVSGFDADKAARDVIENAGYGKYFGHSLGHSLGLEIHEEPRCSQKSKDILVPGHIVTDEPGIYLPGKYGVRIENMLLVTEKGCENLTASRRELIEL